MNTHQNLPDLVDDPLPNGKLLLPDEMEEPEDGQEGKGNPPELVEQLVNENIALAKYFANKWSYGGNIEFDEAFSRAMDGLHVASKRFQPGVGKFSVYAAYWIKAKMGRFFQDASRVKRGAGKAIHISLDSPIGDEAGQTYAESIPDERQQEALANYFPSENAEKVRAAVRLLSQKERIVLVARFGLNGKYPLTLEQVASWFNVTRERIRQIEKKALATLAHRMKKKP